MPETDVLKKQVYYYRERDVTVEGKLNVELFKRLFMTRYVNDL